MAKVFMIHCLGFEAPTGRVCWVAAMMDIFFDRLNLGYSCVDGGKVSSSQSVCFLYPDFIYVLSRQARLGLAFVACARNYPVDWIHGSRHLVAGVRVIRQSHAWDSPSRMVAGRPRFNNCIFTTVG